MVDFYHFKSLCLYCKYKYSEIKAIGKEQKNLKLIKDSEISDFFLSFEKVKSHCVNTDM